MVIEMSTAMFFPEARPEPRVAGSIFTNKITEELRHTIDQVRRNGSIIAACLIESEEYKDPVLINDNIRLIGELAITDYLRKNYISE